MVISARVPATESCQATRAATESYVIGGAPTRRTGENYFRRLGRRPRLGGRGGGVPCHSFRRRSRAFRRLLMTLTSTSSTAAASLADNGPLSCTTSTYRFKRPVSSPRKSRNSSFAAASSSAPLSPSSPIVASSTSSPVGFVRPFPILRCGVRFSLRRAVRSMRLEMPPQSHSNRSMSSGW